MKKTSRELTLLKLKQLKKDFKSKVYFTPTEKKTNEFYLDIFLIAVQVQALESNLNYKFK